MTAPGGLLVLGLGNPLCGDDGLGPAAVARLAEGYLAPPGVRIVDGGTLGLALLPEVEAAGAVIAVDAVDVGAPPGTLVRLAGDAIPEGLGGRLSPHELGLRDLLAVLRLRGQRSPVFVLLGLVPACVAVGTGLSVPVARGLRAVVDAVVAEAERFGFGPWRRRAAGPPAPP